MRKECLERSALEHGGWPVENDDRSDPHVEQLAKPTKEAEKMRIRCRRSVGLPHRLDKLQHSMETTV
jgi:hypothetical protein